MRLPYEDTEKYVYPGCFLSSTEQRRAPATAPAKLAKDSHGLTCTVHCAPYMCVRVVLLTVWTLAGCSLVWRVAQGVAGKGQGTESGCMCVCVCVCAFISWCVFLEKCLGVRFWDVMCADMHVLSYLVVCL